MKPDSAYVRCAFCTRGGNGDKTCGAGGFSKSRILGCFNGVVKPDKTEANHETNRSTFSKCRYPTGMTWEGAIVKEEKIA